MIINSMPTIKKLHHSGSLTHVKKKKKPWIKALVTKSTCDLVSVSVSWSVGRRSGGSGVGQSCGRSGFFLRLEDGCAQRLEEQLLIVCLRICNYLLSCQNM